MLPTSHSAHLCVPDAHRAVVTGCDDAAGCLEVPRQVLEAALLALHQGLHNVLGPQLHTAHTQCAQDANSFGSVSYTGA
jgi:hypothetical protein